MIVMIRPVVCTITPMRWKCEILRIQTSHFGKAYRTENIDRKRPYYDSLVRAGRKRARQEGKKEGEDRG